MIKKYPQEHPTTFFREITVGRRKYYMYLEKSEER